MLFQIVYFLLWKVWLAPIIIPLLMGPIEIARGVYDFVRNDKHRSA